MLVYDSLDGRVHLLDSTTACVLAMLEEGGRTEEEIVRELALRLGVAANRSLLTLALDELRKADLLDQSAPPPTPLVDVTRRELVRKLALTGAAALLVPSIATLTATRGYAEGSPQLGDGRPCESDGVCLSGICCNGFCASTCEVGVGGACPTGSFQCTSGICCSGVCASQACASVAECGACQVSEECNSSPPTCNLGVCGNKRPNGATCSNNNQCCSGNCTGTPKTCT